MLLFEEYCRCPNLSERQRYESTHETYFHMDMKCQTCITKKFRVPSGKRVGKDWSKSEIKKTFRYLPENARCNPSGVVIIQEGIGNFLISDLYRVDTKITKVHADITQSFFKSIRPLLP